MENTDVEKLLKAGKIVDVVYNHPNTPKKDVLIFIESNKSMFNQYQYNYYKNLVESQLS